MEDDRFFHFRDKDKVEVDIDVVIETGAQGVAGVEVKTGATVRDRDFGDLRKLLTATGDRFSASVMPYDGEMELPFGDRLFAVPVRTLWES